MNKKIVYLSYMNSLRITLVLLFGFNFLYSQNSTNFEDSLKILPTDSLKINFIIKRTIEPLENENKYEIAISELQKAKQFINNNKSNELKIDSKHIELLIAQESYEEASKFIEVFEQKSKNTSYFYYQGLAQRYKALIQLYSGNLEQSSKLFFKALEKFKLTKSPTALDLGYGDIAVIGYYSENFKQAIEYWKKCIKIEQELGLKSRMLNNLSNLGVALLEIGEVKEAEENLLQALNIANELNDESLKAGIYTNLTKLEYSKKNFKKAIEYNNLAAQYYESVKKYSSLANIYSNGAELARTGKEYKTALEYINKAFEVMKLTENRTNLYSLYFNKAAIQFDLKEYKDAYQNLLMYIGEKDSIVNAENQKNITELEKKYQLKEQKRENALLNEQVKTQVISNSRMKITIGLISVIVIILSVTAIWMVKQNRAKNLINAQLSEKNNIINLQKSIVEDQHRDITDSIKYAKRIQEAILPPYNLWQKILPSSFIFHLPKDVLSGDFYWIEETKDYIYVAAADCTGHGVPGALISIVNFNLLNKAVLEKNLVTPAEILDAVNSWLTESLHQTYGESTVRDGMDITLIAIHKHSNEILFAGANNSIYVVSNNELEVIKGDKFPVGAFIEDKIQHFSLKKFTVNKGDCIYLFSDGYADQFGGPDGKKYKYQAFQKKLNSISNLDISNQLLSMKQDFVQWQGTHEQVDDVLLIGIKIS